jgi:hypothetical protein
MTGIVRKRLAPARQLSFGLGPVCDTVEFRGAILAPSILSLAFRTAACCRGCVQGAACESPSIIGKPVQSRRCPPQRWRSLALDGNHWVEAREGAETVCNDSSEARKPALTNYSLTDRGGRSGLRPGPAFLSTRDGCAVLRNARSSQGSDDMTDVRQTTAAQLGPGGHWRNWVGNQSFIARHKGEPGSEDELAALVCEASRQNLPIRVAGSGHSFTPVVATSGLLLSLKNMQGLVSADLERKRVVVRSGTRIGDIGHALKRIGLSLANQGDIDTQAIAGALSTGTHGTGIELGCLSSQAVGMRLIQPDGPSWKSTATGIPKRWPPRRFPSACSA